MTDSYASSKLKVHHGTEQKYDKPVEHAKQHIEVPVSWMEEVKFGGDRMRKITRNVNVLGTVEVSTYGTRRVEYGKCMFKGMVLGVVKDGISWSAVEKKEVKGCTA